MNIKFKTMKFVISLLLVGFSLTALSAQVSSDEKNWFRYCIGVKGWFTSDGKCYTGRNPKFESLKLELRKDEEAIEEKGELNMSDLDSGTYFDYDLKGSSDLGTNFDSAVDDATKFKLHYNLWVTEIKNDTHIQGSFFTKKGEKARLIPLTPIEEIGASDPCSNNFNLSGNREWYKLKLDVIVDDPVPLEHPKDAEGNINSRINADEGQLSLKVGDFYQNSKGAPRLQVAVGNKPEIADWETVPYVSVVPNSTIQLFYAQIVGGKNSEKYKDWLGENLMFRVSKTLMNGKESYGQVVKDVRFDPPGPQFYIPQVTRSACDETQVNIFVQLTDVNDQWYMKKGSSLFEWHYSVSHPNSALNESISNGTCSMELDSSSPENGVYKLIPKYEYGDSPFTIQTELIFKLQLQDPKNTNTVFCTKEFRIPGKPDSVKISQPDAKHSLNDTKYHLLNMNNPYAVLNIVDNYEFSHLRKPYKIYKGDDLIQEVAWDLPPTYAGLTEDEKKAVEIEFEADYKEKYFYKDRKSPFGHYFETQFSIWKAQNKEPFLYEGSYIEPSSSYEITYKTDSIYYRILSANKEHLFFFKPNDLSVRKRITFTFENGNFGFIGPRCNIYVSTIFCASDNGMIEQHLNSVRTLIPIYSNIVNLAVFAFNSDVLITREPNKKTSSDPFYWTTIGFDGTITTKEIDDSGTNIRLSSDGKLCFYTSPGGTLLYVYDGTERSIINKDLQISDIIGIDTENKLCIFKSGNNLYAKIYDFDHYYNDFVNNFDSLKYFSSWEKEYRELCKNRWIQTRYGYRLYGVTPNVKETYSLVDKDECKVPFEVEVLIPETPNLVHNITKEPDNGCLKNGTASITYSGGGSPPYNHANGNLIKEGDFVRVDNLGYGVVNEINFMNDNGEINYIHEIEIKYSIPVTLSKKNVTCKTNNVYNGSINLTVETGSSNSKTGEFKLTDLTTNKIQTITKDGIGRISAEFKNLNPRTYKIEVSLDNCQVFMDDIAVEDKIFSVTCDAISAQEFGENGKMSFDFVNRTGTVTWSGLYPSVFNSVDKNKIEFPVPPGIYNEIIANHTDIYGRSCSVSIPSTIVLAPSFDAEINLAINYSDTAQLTVHLKKLNNLASPGAVIEVFNGDQLITNQTINIEDGVLGIHNLELTEGNYTINFSCEKGTVEIGSFALPASPISFTKSLNAAACPGDNTELTFSKIAGGFGSGSYKLGINGVNFSEQKMWQFEGDKAIVYLQNSDQENYSVLGNNISFSKTLIDLFQEDLILPEIVSAHVSYRNPTCHGENNGQISIAEASGGSGEYEWKRENDDTWNSVLDILTVSPGSYKIYLRDSVNNCDPVLIDNVDIAEPAPLVVTDTYSIHPICADGTGSISMTVTGGNGYYVFILSTSSGEELEVKSYEEYLVGFSEEKEFPEIVTIVFPNLTHGDYRITATDPLGCSVSKDFTLEQYLNPVIVDITVDHVRCYNEKNGSISIDSISKGNVDSLFLYDAENLLLSELQWPAQKFEGLISASYKVMVRDSNGCVSAPVPGIVNQPDSMIFSLKSILPVREKGSSTGRIDAQVTGGNRNSRMTALLTSDNNNFLDTLFNKGGHSFEFKTLPAGTYNISVSDAKECAVTRENLVVEEPDDTLAIKVLWVKDALCKAQVGGFSIEGTGGWGKYSYKNAHENGANTDFVPKSTFEDLYAGTYFVTVRDSMGATATKPIEINEPGFLSTQVVDSILPTCENNGVLNVKVSGGTLPYRLAFYGSSDTTQIDSPLTSPFSFKNRSAGEYLLSTIDANGCRYEYSSSISFSNLLSINDFELTSPSEKFALDGQIKAIVTGGKGPLTYEWINRTRQDISIPSDGAEITDVGSGVYAIEVLEASGCSITEDVYLSDVTDEILMIKEIGHETSYNKKNGYALLLSSLSRIDSVEVYYPNGVVEILTDDKTSIVSGVDSLANLSGGKYVVRAFGFDKVEVAEFKIEPYNEFFIDAIAVGHVKVKGEASGSATVSLKGGAAPFKFAWTAVSGSLADAKTDTLSAVVTGLRAGTYHLEVTDRYGNKLDKEFEVLQPDAKLTLEIEEFYNQGCKDYKDAWVQVKTGGGWPNYQYRHAHSTDYQNQRSWFNLEVGEHKFYTVDQRGIVDSVSVTITEPEYLRASVAMIDSIHCYGEANGKIYFDIEGGTAPYRFALLDTDPLWKNETESKNFDEQTHHYYIQDGLAVGERIYQFTDANNCYAIDTLKVFIPQPDPLGFGKFDVTHTTCNTDNGMIEATMKGGTLPYNYQWTDNLGKIISTSATANDLKQNIHYKLDVQDKYHCYQTKTQRINASTKPLIKKIVTQPVLCFGDSNGLAEITEVTAAEPYAPYGFIWSNGSEGDTTQGLSAGDHFVIVRDTNQCETTKYFKVGTPRKLDLSILSLKNAHCYGYNDGHVEISAFGGVGNYAYLWSSGDTTHRADNLTRGEYSLALTDANNCLYEEKFFIDEPPMERVDVGDDFTMCPGNSMVIDGHSFAAHEWQREGEILSEERYFTVDTEGEYALMVTNDRGCFAYDTLSVTIGNDALKADFLMSSEAFLNDTILLFELSNLPLDSLSWTYPDHLFSNETPEGADDYILHLKTLAEGMYNIALYAYSGGCFSKQVKQIEIKDGDREEDDELLGYRDPLIKHFVVSPNPNDGRFNVKVELREAADIHLAVFSISHGVKLDERSRSGLDTYSESFVLGSLNSGVYVVILTAEKERRQLKIIIE